MTGLTILSGARIRMTYRTSQQFSPQFCGRSRREMQTWRRCRCLTLQLQKERMRKRWNTHAYTHTHIHTYTHTASYRMQSQDCWYWMPVAVAVTPWMVSDSRWTVEQRSEVKHRSTSLLMLSSEGYRFSFHNKSNVSFLCYNRSHRRDNAAASLSEQ